MVELNSRAVPWCEGLTLAQLMEREGASGLPTAVVVDGEFVPKSRHPQTLLQPGAKIATFSPITGG